MAHSLTLNQSISSSLTYLDLSGNNLKDDINVSVLHLNLPLRPSHLLCELIEFHSFQNLYNFLAQPNVLEYLDLSATDTFLENVSNTAESNLAHSDDLIRFSLSLSLSYVCV